METTTDSGQDPLKDVSEQEQKFRRHATHTEHLQEKAEELDGFADSIRVSYAEESEVGKIAVYFEYYDRDEDDLVLEEGESLAESLSTARNDAESDAWENLENETFEEFLETAIDLVKGGEFAEAQTYINGCKELVDDNIGIMTNLNLAYYDCQQGNEERILKHLYTVRDWDGEDEEESFKKRMFDVCIDNAIEDVKNEDFFQARSVINNAKSIVHDQVINGHLTMAFYYCEWENVDETLEYLDKVRDQYTEDDLSYEGEESEDE